MVRILLCGGKFLCAALIRNTIKTTKTIALHNSDFHFIAFEVFRVDNN